MKPQKLRCARCNAPFRGRVPKSRLCATCQLGGDVERIRAKQERERAAVVARLRAKLDPGPLGPDDAA